MATSANTELGELLTVAETARLLRVSVVTVRRLARRGELPALRVGSQWRIVRDSLNGAARSTTRRNRRN
jgi:excisionase family DNA binding protein